MSLQEISTTGVMFNNRAGTESNSFPTLQDVGYEWTGAMVDVPEELREWRAIAYDPRSYMYGEEDRRAMDVTNWDVLEATVGAYISAAEVDGEDLPTVERNLRSPSFVWEVDGVEEALSVGACKFGRVLALAPYPAEEDDEGDFVDVEREAMRDLYDEFVHLRGRLSDYPLLDEDAYSALEWEAWQEYAPDALRDEFRDAVRDEVMSEECSDALEEIAGELLPVLAQHLHYESGFSGEYGPEFLEILRDLAQRATVLPSIGQESLLPEGWTNYQDSDARTVASLLLGAGVDVAELSAPVDICYRSRDIGYGVEEGTARGNWVGGSDWTGKREFRPFDRSESLFLFSDEVL